MIQVATDADLAVGNVWHWRGASLASVFPHSHSFRRTLAAQCGRQCHPGGVTYVPEHLLPMSPVYTEDSGRATRTAPSGRLVCWSGASRTLGAGRGLVKGDKSPCWGRRKGTTGDRVRQIFAPYGEARGGFSNRRSVVARRGEKTQDTIGITFTEQYTPKFGNQRYASLPMRCPA